MNNKTVRSYPARPRATIPDKMTPETLRPDDLCRLADLLERPTRYSATVAGGGMRACAAAWEADRAMRQQYLLETIELRDANDALRARVEALEKARPAGEALWPYVFRVMPAKGRFRQAAEMFYDALTALAKEKP